MNERRNDVISRRTCEIDLTAGKISIVGVFFRLGENCRRTRGFGLADSNAPKTAFAIKCAQTEEENFFLNLWQKLANTTMWVSFYSAGKIVLC